MTPLSSWLLPETSHRITRHQRHLVRRALLLAAAMTLFFALFDGFVTGYHLHAVAEGFGCLLLLCVAYLQARGMGANKAAGLGILVVGLLIILVGLTGRAEDGVIVWFVGFPAVPLFLLGRRAGLVVAILFILLATLALSLVVGLEAGPLFTWIAVFNTGGAMVAITALAYLYEVMRVQAAGQLAQEAKTDPLTGLLNRRGLLDAYPRELSAARRFGRPLSLLVLDLDHFKVVNDTHGHDGGDLALRTVADRIKALTREQDWQGRVGGEEFAVLLPNTDLRGAREVGEKIRQGIGASPIDIDGKAVTITVSIGVAQADKGPEGLTEDFDGLFVRADRRLYHAKTRGRNQVVWED